MADPSAADTTPQDAPQGSSQQNINPWSVSGEVGEDGKVKAIDYQRLTKDFGTALIDDALLERFEKVTGHRPHRFMRRQIVFSHRDLTTILDRYEKVRYWNSLPLGLGILTRDRMSRSSCTPAAGQAATVCTLDTPKSLTLSSMTLRCLLRNPFAKLN